MSVTTSKVSDPKVHLTSLEERRMTRKRGSVSQVPKLTKFILARTTHGKDFHSVPLPTFNKSLATNPVTDNRARCSDAVIVNQTCLNDCVNLAIGDEASTQGSLAVKGSTAL